MFWNNQKWTDGDNHYEVRNGDVYVNGDRKGYVSGDELKIGGDTIRIHPYDGSLNVNNKDN